MTGTIFLELVEARTKLASILPFAIGTLFAVAYYHAFDAANTALFFAAMLLFDMTTTAINNLMDYQKAVDPAYRTQMNVIGRARLNPARIAGLILVMLAVATGLGLWLVARTGIVVLAIGVLCFAIGIFYTFGPLPLSRLPLGEVFSGVTMGLAIPVLAVLVNAPAGSLISVGLAWPQLTVGGNLQAGLMLALTSVTPVATIANVMLANNLSDLEADRQNHRYTLPMVVGRTGGLRLYAGLAFVGNFAVLLAVLLGGLRWPTLVLVLTWPVVRKNVRIFTRRQVKAETFSTALKNLVLENGALILGLALSLFVG